jgi:hypothetical protein
MEAERDEVLPYYWLIISIGGVLVILGLLGMAVEYTRLGNVKLNHEDTKFAKIEIPLFQ